jgi:hypothetical protein
MANLNMVSEPWPRFNSFEVTSCELTATTLLHIFPSSLSVGTRFSIILNIGCAVVMSFIAIFFLYGSDASHIRIIFTSDGLIKGID